MAVAWTDDQLRHAATQLQRQHHQGEGFDGLKQPAPLPDAHTAYAVQAAWVELQCEALSTVCAGYKIALTTAAMQTMVGYGDSISGRLLGAQCARLRAPGA